MVYIYILQLENGKYYIGKTTNPEFRLKSHFNSNGSEWTKIYKPLKVLEIISNCTDYDEDKYTRIYMDKYGIENVRGGSFVSVKLEKSTQDILKQMSNGTNNKCFTCGKEGHFAKECKSKEILDEEEEYEVWVCSYCDDEFMDETQCELHTKKCQYKNNCVRCGRKGHSMMNCYAVKDISGCIIEDEESEDDDEEEEEEEDNSCYRCGREGHYANKCYAKSDISGNKL